MRILIDGDACPVKESIYEISLSYHIEVILVTSYDHASDKIAENVSRVYVDKGNDAADFKIMSLLQEGDILVTQDYGLASLALPKKVQVIHHTGMLYNQDNINTLLESRYQSAKLRQSGKRTKGPKKFTNEQRKKFEEIFEKLVMEGMSE